jgi:hypothetical protein
MSKHLGVVIQVLEEVWIGQCFLYEAKISKNMLDLDNVQVHRFSPPYKK